MRVFLAFFLALTFLAGPAVVAKAADNPIGALALAPFQTDRAISVGGACTPTLGSADKGNFDNVLGCAVGVNVAVGDRVDLRVGYGTEFGTASGSPPVHSLGFGAAIGF